MLLIQLWDTKTDVLFVSRLMLRKLKSLQKFCKIRHSIVVARGNCFCKVLVLIKAVPWKNDYFLHQKFELHRYQMNGFLYWFSFYWNKCGTYISHELIVWLIPTWIWYDLLTVSHFWLSLVFLFHLIYDVIVY